MGNEDASQVQIYIRLNARKTSANHQLGKYHFEVMNIVVLRESEDRQLHHPAHARLGYTAFKGRFRCVDFCCL